MEMRALVFQAQSYVQGLPAQKKKNFKEVFPSMEEKGGLIFFDSRWWTDGETYKKMCIHFDFFAPKVSGKQLFENMSQVTFFSQNVRG